MKRFLSIAAVFLLLGTVPAEVFAYRVPTGVTVTKMSRREVRRLKRIRNAQRSSSSASSVRSRTTSSSSSSSRSSSSRGRTDSSNDLTVRSNFLVLGEVTPVLGAVDFYAASEPIDIDTIRVHFLNDPSSIQQVRVYAESDGRLLGTSFRDGTGEYDIAVKAGSMMLPHREETGVYVRALMKPADGGASGGQAVQIERIEMDGDGVWSGADYTVSSSETFLAFETAPAVITGFSPAISLSSSTFISGPSVTLWDYNVSGRTTDNDFEPALTSLTFRLAKSSNVTLSDAHLSVPDSGAESDCVISTGYITCASIPESVGSVDGVRRIRLVADVDYSGSGGDPFMQVTLHEGGTPSGGGDVEWTDGRTDYDWLQIDAPIAKGINYK